MNPKTVVMVVSLAGGALMACGVPGERRRSSQSARDCLLWDKPTATDAAKQNEVVEAWIAAASTQLP